jgi:hypothetical protein
MKSLSASQWLQYIIQLLIAVFILGTIWTRLQYRLEQIEMAQADSRVRITQLERNAQDVRAELTELRVMLRELDRKMDYVVARIDNNFDNDRTAHQRTQRDSRERE